MNIPIGLIALYLLYWSLQCFELEKNIPEFTWPALRAEFVDNFDCIGVSVHLVSSDPSPKLITIQIPSSGGNFMHGAWLQLRCTASLYASKFSRTMSFTYVFLGNAPTALALLIPGPLLLIIGVVYEIRTPRVAVLPSALFRSRTEGKLCLIQYRIHLTEWTVIILIASFFHNVAFNAGTFYLALYYQVCFITMHAYHIIDTYLSQAALGVGPLLCGVLMLPYSLGGALASVPIALFNDYLSRKTRNTGCYKYVIITGLAVATIGFGAYLLL